MRLKIFKEYYLVFIDDKIKVLSVKRSKEKIINPIIRYNSLYYAIFENGVKKEYSLRELIRIALGHVFS